MILDVRREAKQIGSTGNPRHRLFVGLTCAFSVLAATELRAYDLPTVNLGLTSFLDGAPPSGPGWYAAQYFQYYTASRLADSQGNRLGLPKQDLSVFAGLTQFLYLSPARLGPGSFGISLLVPYVLGADVDDGLGGAALRAERGLADIVIGPFYQFDPVMGPNGPRFIARIEASVIAPTGHYDRSAAVNPGANFWSFNPHIAGTFFITPKWTLSARLHYLWNATNNDPALSHGPGVFKTRAGQAVHANFATEYAVMDKLRIGLNGYWLQQTTNTRVNGLSQSGSKERVWALGPGAVYGFDKNNFLFVNGYHEFAARNRPEGQRYVLRYVHHFE
ncbi:SphA family protein [Pseudochelatococcus sp. B33]